MKLALVILFAMVLAVYAQRNWFVALCFLIVYTGTRGYHGMPDSLDFAGFNEWSAMLGSVTLAWFMDRVRQSRSWTIPKGAAIVLLIYLCGECIAVARMCVDLDVFVGKASAVSPSYAEYTVRGVIVDQVYVPLRFMFMGFMLMDGMRTRERLLMGIAATLGCVLVYSIVILKEIPISALGGDGMEYRHRIAKWTGRHPNDLARVFASAFWVSVAAAQIKFASWKWRSLFVLAALPFALALAHTCSRGGYLGFVTCGLLAIVVMRSWKSMAVLATVCVGVIAFAPSVSQRILAGVDTTGNNNDDKSEITGGRDTIWPAAMVGISESPLIGHGFFGYVLSSAMDRSAELDGGELHPHNAYLEALLDHGWLGAWTRLLPFVVTLAFGAILGWQRSDPVLQFAGITALSWSGTTLAMGLTGQHFGFTENLFTFWCMAGVVVAARVLQQERGRHASHLRRRPATAMRSAAVGSLLAPGMR